MDSIILLIVLVVLILLGAPVGFTLILLPTVYILITDAAPMILIPSQMFSAIDFVPLTPARRWLTGTPMKPRLGRNVSGSKTSSVSDFGHAPR